MSAIQTLPFALDEHPADGTSNYESNLGRTYISASDSGLYRLVKYTGSTVTTPGALAGVGLSAAVLTAPFSMVLGATGAVDNITGVTHPSLVGLVANSDYVLVACGGDYKIKDTATPATVVGLQIGAAITTGIAIAGTVGTVRALADADGYLLAEFNVSRVVQTAIA